MIGTIRARESCPICARTFQTIDRDGLLCKKHKTRPRRYFIDLWHKRQIKIYSDKQGNILDSYSRAFKVLSIISKEIEDHTFDLSKYYRHDARQFFASTLLDRFQSYKEKEIAPSYWGNYKGMIRAAKDFFEEKDLRELRKLDLISFKEKLEASGIHGKTLKNYLDNLKTFLRYCRDDLEVIPGFPKMPEVDVPAAEFKWLSQKDQAALFEMIPESDRPIFAFMMLQGARSGEARALRAKDIDLKTGMVTISATFSGKEIREKRKGKKAKAVTAPIHPEIYDFIAGRVRGSLPGAFVFVNPRTGGSYSYQRLRKVWDALRIKAEIGTLRIHDATRHSFVSQLINAGVPIYDAMIHAGHSTVKTTERYAHPDLERLKTNLSKLSLKKVATIPGLSLEEKRAENQ